MLLWGVVWNLILIVSMIVVEVKTVPILLLKVVFFLFLHGFDLTSALLIRNGLEVLVSLPVLACTAALQYYTKIDYLLVAFQIAVAILLPHF